MKFLDKNSIELDKYLENPEYIAELEKKGKRVLFFYEDGKATLWEDENQISTEPFQIDIQELTKDSYIKSFCIKGIITYFNDNDVPCNENDKNAEPILFLYDMKEYDGIDISKEHLVSRKAEVNTICEVYNWKYDYDSSIRYLPHTIRRKRII